MLPKYVISSCVKVSLYLGIQETSSARKGWSMFETSCAPIAYREAKALVFFIKLKSFISENMKISLSLRVRFLPLLLHGSSYRAIYLLVKTRCSPRWYPICCLLVREMSPLTTTTTKAGNWIRVPICWVLLGNMKS